MTDEIEEVKAQLKVLEKKLALLEELEKTKTPCEEAYKRVYGKYPVEEVSENLTAEDNWNVVSWSAFQNGYNAAYEEKVEEEGTWNYDPDAKFRKQEEVNTLQEKEWTYKITDEKGETNPYKQYLNSKKPQTLYDVIADWWDEIFTNGNPSGQNIESLVEQIVKLLPDAIIEPDEDWDYGYNDYRYKIMKKFKGR